MTSILALPTVYAGHCKGGHANDPLCPASAPAQELLASWSEIIPDSADRFVSVLNDEGILDRETGLVWEKTPNNALADAGISARLCYSKMVGNRYGWRLPTITELGSLVDASQSNPALPAEHPFVGVVFTATDHYYATNPIGTGPLFFTVTFNSNGIVDSNQSSASRPSWCVRGR